MSVFSKELITFDLNASNKVDAITQMANLVVASGRGNNAEQITNDVLARD
jgi:mannitol/fructose-specific phosphotransferase system IIA component (Ntr-type)